MRKLTVLAACIVATTMGMVGSVYAGEPEPVPYTASVQIKVDDVPEWAKSATVKCYTLGTSGDPEKACKSDENFPVTKDGVSHDFTINFEGRERVAPPKLFFTITFSGVGSGANSDQTQSTECQKVPDEGHVDLTYALNLSQAKHSDFHLGKKPRNVDACKP